MPGLSASARTLPRGDKRSHLQALGQPQLLQLAHVALEGELLPADQRGQVRGAHSGGRGSARALPGPWPARLPRRSAPGAGADRASSAS